MVVGPRGWSLEQERGRQGRECEFFDCLHILDKIGNKILRNFSGKSPRFCWCFHTSFSEILITNQVYCLFVFLFLLATAKGRVADGIPIPSCRHFVVECFVCIFCLPRCRRQRKFTVPNDTSYVEVFSLFQSGFNGQETAFYPARFRENCFSPGFILRACIQYSSRFRVCPSLALRGVTFSRVPDFDGWFVARRGQTLAVRAPRQRQPLIAGVAAQR